MKTKITCRPRYNPWLKKYLNTKTFSKILALCVLINSVPINSLAGILSEDGRYETFEGSDITVNDVLEEDTVDVEIEGNTLVNLVKMPDVKEKTIETSSTAGIGNILADFNNKCNIKQNTTYTFIVDVKVTNATDNFSTYVKLDYINSNDENIYSSTVENQIIDDGFFRFVKTFTTTDDAVKFNNLSVIASSTNGNLSTGTQTVTNMILLEGDYSDTYFNYFEDTKSVGQDNKNKHEIEILSKNDNLIEYIELNGVNSRTGEDYNYPTYMRTNYFLVEENTLYNVTNLTSNTKNLVAYFYDKNRNYISYTFNIDTSFTTPTKTRYVRLDMKKIDDTNFTLTDVENANIQVSKKKYDYYLPHESTALKIPLSEPLRGLPNGVRDRIIKRNGQWIVERNCGEIVLDGSENWGLFTKDYSGLSNYQYLVDDIIPQGAKSGYNISISDKFMWGTVSDNPVVEDYEHHRIQGIDNAKRVYLWLNKNTAPTVEELKNWLRNNNVRIVYQLETPTYKPLNIDSTINTYLDTTHISTNSIIPANLKVTVDRVANKAKEYSELAKENPTIENISLARMWTNKMRESILKDEFQDNIDSITEITDMTLERKTASANLDVYIKSENMLSMNLSTNSITFDDFSGVEDMTKENAVNISINSSLPYNLNAYLATDIQNSDKSVTMNKDILSIKDNSELDYQTFSSINDKVVLKSNCNSGNDKQHDINLKLNGGIAHEKDVYKTTIKFEAEQK